MSQASRNGASLSFDACVEKWQSSDRFHIYVAQDCNLRCAYCFNRHGTFGRTPGRMDLETARAAARFVWEHRKRESPRLAVRFPGGEPFLGREAMFEIIRTLRRAAERDGCKVQFSIDTNGTLLDDSALEFLDQAGGVQINVSIDGGRAATDALRRGPQGGGVWDRVVRNIRRVRGHDGVTLGVSAVLTRDNCDAAAVLARLRRMDFRHITLTDVWVSPLNPRSEFVDIGEPEEGFFLESMVAALACYFRDLAAAMQEARPPEYFLANVAAVLKAAQPARADTMPRRCAGSAPAIDCNGDLIPCAGMAHLPAVKIGHILTGFDSEAVRRFHSAPLSVAEVSKCRVCSTRLSCGGPCLQFASPESDLGNLLPAEAYCRLRRREARLGAMALEALAREHGSRWPALLDYARAWYGTDPAPGESTSDTAPGSA
ncbi:MAG: radical SAM protein [Bryobacterales bacterium]|nr:radical SAM protein [Bryobacterales bacterium]